MNKLKLLGGTALVSVAATGSAMAQYVPSAAATAVDGAFTALSDDMTNTIGPSLLGYMVIATLFMIAVGWLLKARKG
jgi:hypothetical protein